MRLAMAQRRALLGTWAILPGQVVAVFPDAYPSDAAITRGYYGSIVRLDRQSARRQRRRGRWKHVVRIPALGGDCLVRACDMIATSEFLPPAERIGPRCEVRVAENPADDMPRIEGEFRLGDGPTWHDFCFSRQPILQAHYRLSLRVDDGCGVFTLRYFVPQGQPLNRDIVRRGLAQICCVALFPC
ncbi:MAG: hypothetical protein RIC55_10185 [Pirellulaceae bacterium]